MSMLTDPAATAATGTSPLATAAARNLSEEPEAGTALSSDFQTFLQMLTVQMQNQDPLNPIDSTDYAVQLATFSSVEQQVKTNDLLDALGQQFGLMQVSQLGGWVGMEVRAPGPARFDGAAIDLDFAPDPRADSSLLLVTDANTGALLESRSLVPGTGTARWDGIDDNGITHAPGLYSFEVEHYAKGEVLSRNPAESFARVIEVRTGVEGARLVTINGTEVAAASVTSLREPR